MKWADPPPRKGTAWDEVAAALVERPGEWALIATVRSPTTGTQIRRGELKAFRPMGAFETTVRVNDSDGRRRWDLYVRYVGDAA